MTTAVQLRPARPHRPRAELAYGQPHTMVSGKLGPVAIFEPRALVAYRLRSNGDRRLYVFRTLDQDDPLAACVPGVRPRVALLLALRSRDRERRALRLLAFLSEHLVEPASLPDSFYLRVGCVLGGRLPPQKVLLSLLDRHRALPGVDALLGALLAGKPDQKLGRPSVSPSWDALRVAPAPRPPSSSPR